MAEPLACAMGWAAAAAILTTSFPAMVWQAAPAPAPVQAPPPVTILPPVPYVPLPGAPPGVPDSMVSLIRAQGTIPDVHPGNTFYLVVEDVFAGVIVTENGVFRGGWPLFSPEEVLRVLADRRLAFMWPALEAWAGPGLAQMQARTLADARKRYRTVRPRRAGSAVESSARPATRALLQLADELDGAGFTEEAVALLREPLAKPPGEKAEDKLDYLTTALRFAAIRYGRDDPKRAAEVLKAASKTLADSHYAVNLDINRASYLVRGGQFAEGLELIDRALARYVGEKEAKGAPDAVRVPGSMRMFTLIRACALNGLGRKDEAAVEMQALMNAPQPRDRDFVLESNRVLHFRGLLCLREIEPLADFIVETLNGPNIADGLTVWLQRDLDSSDVDPALVQAVRAHPKVKAAMATRIRVLGPELKAVLNRMTTAY